MKKIVVIVCLFFSLKSCENPPFDTWSFVELENSSDKPIWVCGSYRHSRGFECQEWTAVDAGKCDEFFWSSGNIYKFLKAKDTLRVYISDVRPDGNINESMGWPEILSKFKIVQRYDVSGDDLRLFKRGNLAYPPTENMKSIKMWPPYEESANKQ